MKKLIIIIIGILITGIVVTGCNKDTKVIIEQELHVAAAANLRFAFAEIGELFEEEFDCKVIFQFGSTGNLAQQIINGAPVDVFAPASENFINELISTGDIIEETKSLYAIGRIILITKDNLNVELKKIEDLKLEEFNSIAIANPNHAPYGLAAKEALESIKLWDVIENKVVYGENISQTMQFVQTGNASAGITALSLVDREAEYILIDDELHNPLNQMIGVVSHTNSQELAKLFIDFIKSAKAETVFIKYGYSLP